MAKRISVLIADDTLISLEGIKAILKKVGEIDVIAAASTPEQVIELATRMTPDVVVLDLKWFGDALRGARLIQEIRGLIPDAAIIAMTAYPELLDKAVKAGANFAMNKDFDREELVQAIHSVIIPIKTNVLFCAADPTDIVRLRVGEELREIQEKLQMSKLRDKFELHQRMSARPSDLSQALLDIQPEIVHFSGHGSSSGALCFENQIGEKHPIPPHALASLFEQFADKIDCVLLNACYSEIQANSIAKYINYVVGMKHEIGDQAAIAFAVGFYQALGAGREIEDAYKLGCVQIDLQGIPEHLTPVLLKKK